MARRINRRRKKRKNTRKVFGFCVVLMMLIIAFNVILQNNVVESQEYTVQVGQTNDDIKLYTDILGAKLNIAWLFNISDEVNYNKVGDYKIQCVSKLGGKKEIFVIVHVVDTIPPYIFLSGDEKISSTSSSEYLEPGFYAYDEYDGDITQNVKTTIRKNAYHEYTIFYEVKDSSGNTATAQRDLYVDAGTIYLTFDDGPSEKITPKILDLLKENDIKATFFVIGFDREKDGLITRIHDEGHTIGIHGLSHDYSKIYKSIGNLMNNFYLLEDLVYSLTGNRSGFIRFPGGSSNTVSKKYCEGIMTEAVELVTQQGYTYFDWNVDSQDAGGADTAEEIYDNVVSGIKAGRENVVLMHDSAGHQATLEALEWIINYGLKNDYFFKSITDDTTQVKHNVAN